MKQTMKNNKSKGKKTKQTKPPKQTHTHKKKHF